MGTRKWKRGCQALSKCSIRDSVVLRRMAAGQVKETVSSTGIHQSRPISTTFSSICLSQDWLPTWTAVVDFRVSSDPTYYCVAFSSCWVSYGNNGLGSPLICCSSQLGSSRE
ncbi:unnamed protein product [Calypogeia fissa]